MWEKIWNDVAPADHPGTVYLDASHIKVHRSGLNPAGGRESQALGLTKGGWNTKLHAALDRRGIPRAILLSPGNDADVSHATAVLQEFPAKMVVADKGYDSDAVRIWLYERDTTPCIPSRSNRNDPLPYRRQSYRKRYVVETFFAHIKTFRRVATRYDKLVETWLALPSRLGEVRIVILPTRPNAPFLQAEAFAFKS